MRWFLVALLATLPCSAGIQEKAEDKLLLTSREEWVGTLQGYDSDGFVRFQSKSGRSLRIPIERVSRIHLGKPEAVQSDPREPKIHFLHGGVVSLTSLEYRDRRFEARAFDGEFRIARSEVKMVSLAPLTVPMPEVKEEKLDLVVREIDKKGEKPAKESVAEYGEVVALTPEKLLWKVGGETREFERATVRRIHLFEEAPPRELSPGWFAKLLLRNGDRLVGVLTAIAEKKVAVFSHVLGEVAVPRNAIHSVSFLSQARASVGNLLVCDQTGVREFDRGGKELWSFTLNAHGAWAAVKLENGNVLIANSNYSQVLEVDPEKQIAWKLDPGTVNYPYDVQRLENGNTLVAEYYGNAVSEFDAKRVRVWSYGKVSQPTSAQRLENGNTLIASNDRVIEVDKSGEEVWRAKLDKIRPWRAVRLEGGHTLICDSQRGQVVEIDSGSKEVWKKDGLSRPVAAIRLEDGNTVILEQGANRLIEVDSSMRVVNEIKGLVSPQGLSTY